MKLIPEEEPTRKIARSEPLFRAQGLFPRGNVSIRIEGDYNEAPQTLPSLGVAFARVRNRVPD
jgi:hypothetical protein